jgi:hypothetical protein
VLLSGSGRESWHLAERAGDDVGEALQEEAEAFKRQGAPGGTTVQSPKGTSLSTAAVSAIVSTVAFILLMLITILIASLMLRRRCRGSVGTSKFATARNPTFKNFSSKPEGRPASDIPHASEAVKKDSKKSVTTSPPPPSGGLGEAKAKVSQIDPSRSAAHSQTASKRRSHPMSNHATLGSSEQSAQHKELFTKSAAYSCFTLGSMATNRQATMAGGNWHQKLQRALNNMRISSPPQPFAGRYVLLQDQAVGGQAVIAFARDEGGNFFQYAVKFFRSREDFETEAQLYQHPVIRKTLPQVFHASENADGALESPGGFVFPPFLVLERGAPLRSWLKEPRTIPSVLTMFYEVALQLKRVHHAQYVHRDLKPDNVLLMLQTQTWKLIDYGIAKPTGMHLVLMSG